MRNTAIGLLILGLLFGLVFLIKPPDFVKSLPQIGVLIPGSVEFFAVQKKGLDQAAKKYGS